MHFLCLLKLRFSKFWKNISRFIIWEGFIISFIMSYIKLARDIFENVNIFQFINLDVTLTFVFIFNSKQLNTVTIILVEINQRFNFLTITFIDLLIIITFYRLSLCKFFSCFFKSLQGFIFFSFYLQIIYWCLFKSSSLIFSCCFFCQSLYQLHF